MLESHIASTDLDLPSISTLKLHGAQSPISVDAGSFDVNNECLKDSNWRPTVIYFHTENFDSTSTLPRPAPPPKQHYSTFWRSVTRRIYRKESEVLKQMGHEPSVQMVN